MARIPLLIVLGLGTVAGFASGFHELRMHREFGWGPPWAAYEGRRYDAWADACVRAADRAHSAPSPPAASPPDPAVAP